MQVSINNKKGAIIMLMVLILAFFVYIIFQVNHEVEPKILKEYINSNFGVDNSRNKKESSIIKIHQDINRPVIISSEKPLSGNKSISLLGQGIILNKNGYILTNKHVVENTKDIIFVIYKGKKFYIQSIWRDKEYDLAVLKIDKILQNFIAPKFQKDFEEDVIGRNIGVWKISTEQILSGYAKLLSGNYQTNIPGKSGDSGSILVNNNGEIIGINTAIDDSQYHHISAIGISDMAIQEMLHSIIEKQKLEVNFGE